jgi:hypothetical protein
MLGIILLLMVLVAVFVWRSIIQHHLMKEITSLSELNITTKSSSSYVVLMKDTINDRFIIHQPCINDRTITMSPYIENAMFLLTINPNASASLKSLYGQDISTSGYISNINDSKCKSLPTISSEPYLWELRSVIDPLVPLYDWSFQESEQGGLLDCKLASPDNQFIHIQNQDIMTSTRVDEASVIRFVNMNNDFQSTISYTILLQLGGKYVNHTSKIPTLSDTPVSPFYLLTFTESTIDDGFHKSTFTIQSHPKSDTKYFPSWYFNWDLAQGCIMESTNIMKWTFEVSKRLFTPNGVILCGYLIHSGYYIDIINNKLATSVKKPVTESCITFFNNYMI